MVTEGATGKPSGDHVCRWGGALRWCQSFPCWCWSGARWSSARVLRCANHDWGNYLGAEGGPGRVWYRRSITGRRQDIGDRYSPSSPWF